jgi:O-antigen/teichoic acid export membrane protein
VPSNVPITPVAHGILYDGLYTFALRTLNIFGALAVGILTARVLGPAGKGIYALPMVQAGLVSTAFAGLSSATSYYLLNGKAGRRIAGPTAITTLLFVLVAALAVVPVAALAHAMWAAPAAIASLPAAAAVNVISGYVVGIRRVRIATTVTLATTVLTFALTAAGLILVARTPYVAIAAWIASTTLVAAIAFVVMLLHARRLEAGNPVQLRAYIWMALKVGATGLVTLLNYRADLYIVAVLLPPIDLGLYSVATSAPQSLLLPTQVAALVTSPHIGGMERHAAARLAARCVRNNLLTAIVICVALFAAAPLVIRVIYGSAFLPLVPSLRILLIGVVALAIGSPISTYYTLKLARPEISLVLSGASAALCIAGSLILVPHFGIAGAAVASTVAYVAGQGLALFYFARGTGIAPRAMLVPTQDDFRLYWSLLRQLYRDTVHVFTLRLHAPGKST